MDVERAMPRDVQKALRQDVSVGGSHAQIWLQAPEAFKKRTLHRPACLNCVPKDSSIPAQIESFALYLTSLSRAPDEAFRDPLPLGKGRDCRVLRYSLAPPTLGLSWLADDRSNLSIN